MTLTWAAGKHNTAKPECNNNNDNHYKKNNKNKTKKNKEEAKQLLFTECIMYCNGMVY